MPAKNIHNEIHMTKGTAEVPGISGTTRCVSFAVSAAADQSVELWLYKKGAEEPFAKVPMLYDAAYGRVRSVRISGFVPSECEYLYCIDSSLVRDPYAKLICGNEEFGVQKKNASVRCGFMFGSYAWGSDAHPLIPQEDVIAYNTHLRGFTMDSSSGVRHKGTFRGLIEKIPYLKALGINRIELMPIYEFIELAPEEEHTSSRPASYKDRSRAGSTTVNYWGYASENYFFAPKASYASGDAPVKELRQMVKALHAAGMELMLEFCFPNQTDQNLIVSCIRHWVREYHIDGVHLTGQGLPVAAICQDPLLSDIRISCGYFPYHEMEEIRDSKGGVRLSESHEGFLQSARGLLAGYEDQLGRFAGSVKYHPDRASVINYMTNHNGFTLADLVSYAERHNEANGEDGKDGNPFNMSMNCGEEGPTKRRKVLSSRLRKEKNAIALMLLSQGIPMLYGGDELGNSQQGNNNAYCQDNPMGWINWKNAGGGRKLLSFTKDMIALRKAFPVLHQKKGLRMTDYRACSYPDLSLHSERAWYADYSAENKAIGMMYACAYAEKGISEVFPKASETELLYVAYNFHDEASLLALPGAGRGRQWYVLMDTSDAAGGIYPGETARCLKASKTVEVPADTVMVLAAR